MKDTTHMYHSCHGAHRRVTVVWEAMSMHFRIALNSTHVYINSKSFFAGNGPFSPNTCTGNDSALMFMFV